MGIRFLVALLLPALLLAAPAGQDTWDHFFTWFKTYTGSPMPPEFMKAYSAELARQGLNPEQVRVRMGELPRLFAEHAGELMAANFRNIYRNHPELFSQQPTALVLRAAELHKPGRALDAAMGQGRNSIALARLGWEVTGYDISEDGLQLAREAAARHGLNLNTVKATHQDFDFGQQRWDLIVLTYSLANMSDAAFVTKLTDALAPGGLIVVEQLNSGTEAKGPANALFNSFARLRVIHYEDAVGDAEWPKKPARVGRLIAQKD